MTIIKDAMRYYTSPWVQYFDGSGRADRSEYFIFHSGNFFIGCLFGLLGVLFESDTFTATTVSAFILAQLIPSLTLSMRRLHDSDRSALWLFAPIANTIFLLWPGTKGENRFGKPPVMQ